MTNKHIKIDPIEWQIYNNVDVVFTIDVVDTTYQIGDSHLGVEYIRVEAFTFRSDNESDANVYLDVFVTTTLDDEEEESVVEIWDDIPHRLAQPLLTAVRNYFTNGGRGLGDVVIDSTTGERTRFL